MQKNMKEHSPNSIRTYDKDGYRRRAACVCVKDDKEDEVLLVSRPRQVNQWIFPGGGIEPKEDTRDAASREVIEEAGVIGSIVRCLGVVETENTRTCVFVLQVSDELSEWDDSISCGRKRMWFTVEEARKALGESHAQLCYLDRLKSQVSYSPNSNMPGEGHIGCCPPKLMQIQQQHHNSESLKNNGNNQSNQNNQTNIHNSRPAETYDHNNTNHTTSNGR